MLFQVFILSVFYTSTSNSLTVQITPDCNSKSCADALSQALAQCHNTSEPCTVDFTPGVYAFSTSKPGGASAVIQGLVNITISAYKAEMMMQNLQSGFDISNSTNVTIKGLTIDMFRMAFSLGTVTSIVNQTVVFAVDSKKYPFYSGVEWEWLLRVEAILEFNTTTNRPETGGFEVYGTFQAYISPAEETYSLNTTLASRFKKGSAYVLRHWVYGLDAFTGNEVHGLVIQDVTVYTTPGMGVFCHYCSDIYLQGLNFVKKREDSWIRPMSLTADACHLFSTTGFIEIADSVFEGQGDDGLNIHGHFQEIESIVNSHSLVLGKDGQANNPEPKLGDIIEFRNRTTLQPYFTTTVSEIHSTMLETNDPLPSTVQQYDLVVSLTLKPSHVYIHNCTYKDNRARGQLLKSDNITVVNNSYDHPSGACIQVQPDGCYWYESTVVRNWTVMGNRFIGCNYAEARTVADVYVSECVPNWKGSNACL
jgi:hypothetical protein